MWLWFVRAEELLHLGNVAQAREAPTVAADAAAIVLALDLALVLVRVFVVVLSTHTVMRRQKRQQCDKGDRCGDEE